MADTPVGFGEPFPNRDEIVTPGRKATDILKLWVETSLLARVNSSPARVQAPEVLPDVGGSTSGTLGGQQAAGLYRVTAYREVMVADPVSSSLAIAINWTHNGKALSRLLSTFSGAPQAVTDTVGDVTAIEIDAGSPISYSITYASNTPGLAKFAVTMSAELLASIG